MMSTLPNASTVAAQQRLERGAIGDVGWLTRSERRPMLSISRGGLVDRAQRGAPWRRRRRRLPPDPSAMARPMPEVPPMTTAVAAGEIQSCKRIVRQSAQRATAGRAAGDEPRAAEPCTPAPTLPFDGPAATIDVRSCRRSRACRLRAHLRGQLAHQAAPGDPRPRPSSACACWATRGARSSSRARAWDRARGSAW